MTAGEAAREASVDEAARKTGQPEWKIRVGSCSEDGITVEFCKGMRTEAQMTLKADGTELPEQLANDIRESHRSRTRSRNPGLEPEDDPEDRLVRAVTHPKTHPEAKIEDGVRIHPSATVGKGAEVSEGASLERNVVVGPGARVGDDATVPPGTHIPPGKVFLASRRPDPEQADWVRDGDVRTVIGDAKELAATNDPNKMRWARKTVEQAIDGVAYRQRQTERATNQYGTGTAFEKEEKRLETLAEGLEEVNRIAGGDRSGPAMDRAGGQAQTPPAPVTPVVRGIAGRAAAGQQRQQEREAGVAR